MKNTLIIFALFLICLTACNKDENQEVSGDPATFNLYIELLKPDGTSFEEGEVEAKSGYQDEDGMNIYVGDWYNLPVSQYHSDLLNKKVFGPFELGIGWESGEDPEEGTEWVMSQLLLLRYEGISEMDALRGRDSIRFPEFRYFDIFRNGLLVKSFGDPDIPMEGPMYITIQK